MPHPFAEVGFGLLTKDEMKRMLNSERNKGSRFMNEGSSENLFLDCASRN
jgi:hypothetical protein